MRLLDVHQLKLKEFPFNDTLPSYAILSHVWGDGEVSLQDLQTPAASSMAGYVKIKKCCEVAIQDGFEYVWIDTCCIDKTSSAELSEAINSMYKWYSFADVCYAYLSDVQGQDDLSSRESSFSKSRWFTRGWTLQELLSPEVVIFYDREWVDIGTKRTLQDYISCITGIPPEVLLNRHETVKCSIAQRMSWAAKRETTRVEDIAYCLMGIFDVNMPTLYGEGRKAFIRLQYEIMKGSDDHSLFAWVVERGISDDVFRRRVLEDHYTGFFGNGSGLLTTSPRYFEYAQGVRRLKINNSKHPFSMTNNGLHIWLPLVPIRLQYREVQVYQIIFNCFDSGSGHRLTVFLSRDRSGQFFRIFPALLCTTQTLEYDPEPVELYVKEDYYLGPVIFDSEMANRPLSCQFHLVENSSPEKGYILLGASSPEILQQKMVNFLLGSGHSAAGVAYIVVGAKHNSSAQFLLALGVCRDDISQISYNIRAEKMDIEQAIAIIEESGTEQPSFDIVFQGVKSVDRSERIVQRLPSGQRISIHFRRGPISSDGIHICHIVMEFVAPDKFPTLAF